jgi:hypothetical protein
MWKKKERFLDGQRSERDGLVCVVRKRVHDVRWEMGCFDCKGNAS